jgi:hypothetical protein
MTNTDPKKMMLDTLAAYRAAFGPLKLLVTTEQFKAATPDYPIHTEYREYPATPWDSSVKHPQHEKIMGWRAGR